MLEDPAKCDVLSYREMAKSNFSETHTQQREQPDSPEARHATRVAVAPVLLRPTPWLVPPPSRRSWQRGRIKKRMKQLLELMLMIMVLMDETQLRC